MFQFLDAHYGEPLTIRDVASLLAMSRSAFYRLFKEATGEHFKGYLNRFRIAKAQELLMQTDKPITDVALEVGFCDQSYFGLFFRKLTHLTPGEYRQCLAEEDLKGRPTTRDLILDDHAPKQRGMLRGH